MNARPARICRRAVPGQEQAKIGRLVRPVPCSLFPIPYSLVKGKSIVVSRVYFDRKRSHGDELASNQCVTEVLRLGLGSEAKRSQWT
jgi:hypothetical protein